MAKSRSISRQQNYLLFFTTFIYTTSHISLTPFLVAMSVNLRKKQANSGFNLTIRFFLKEFLSGELLLADWSENEPIKVGNK